MASKRETKTVKLNSSVPIELPLDIVEILDALGEVHHGAPRTRIVKDAIALLLDTEMRENSSFKLRFQDALAEIKKANESLPPPRKLAEARPSTETVHSNGSEDDQRSSD